MLDAGWSQRFRAGCYARGAIDGPSPIARVRFSTFPALVVRRRLPPRLVALLRSIDREPGTLTSAEAAVRSAVPGWRVEVRRLAEGGSILIGDPGRLVAFPLGLVGPEPLFPVLWFGRTEAGRLGGPRLPYTDHVSYRSIAFPHDLQPE